MPKEKIKLTDEEKIILAKEIWPEVVGLIEQEDEEYFKPMKFNKKEKTEGGEN